MTSGLLQNVKGGVPVASKSCSAAKFGWDAGDYDHIDVDVDMGYVTEATEVGRFESECPCCGTVIAFRLVCSAVADETELTNGGQ